MQPVWLINQRCTAAPPFDPHLQGTPPGELDRFKYLVDLNIFNI